MRSIPRGRLVTHLERYHCHGSWRRPALWQRGALPFLILVSTILRHRTRDELTAWTTLRLMYAFPTPVALSRASVPRNLSLTRRPPGFPHTRHFGVTWSASRGKDSSMTGFTWGAEPVTPPSFRRHKPSYLPPKVIDPEIDCHTRGPPSHPLPRTGLPRSDPSRQSPL